MNLQILDPILEEELISYEYIVLAGTNKPGLPHITDLFINVKNEWDKSALNDAIKHSIEQGTHQLYEMTKNQFHQAVYGGSFVIPYDKPSDDLIIDNLSKFVTRYSFSYIDFSDAVTNAPVPDLW